MKGLTEKERDRIVGRILAAVRAGKTFFLAGHEKPDGDTIGSELAFASLLRRMGKKADVYNAQPIPRSLAFLPGASRVRTAARVEKNYDVAVVFECSGPDRMGNILDLDARAGTVINIDHHAHHSRFGDINLIDPTASSNSEQLYYVFQQARLPLTKAEATALYVGLVTDTGRFQQDNTRPDSHRVAAALVAAGAPVAEICRRLYDTRSEAALRLMARALASLQLAVGGRVAYLRLSREDFDRTGADPEEAEDVVGQGLMPPSVHVAVSLREEEKGRTRVSFRGKGRVDLCRVAVSLGGGGHKSASGCTLPVSPEAAFDRVRRALEPAVAAAFR